jgi:hypothetical protein
MTATVAVEVWIRPCDSVSGTRWTRWVPASHLKTGVRAVALDSEDDLLEAARLVAARLELLDGEAAALGIARQHPEEVCRPERGLVAADALADLDDHVLPVGRVVLDERELQLLLERVLALLELGHELPQVAVAARGLEVVASRAPLPGELVRALQLLRSPSDLGRLAVVVVDGRIGQPLLRLAVGTLQLVDKLVHGGHEAG